MLPKALIFFSDSTLAPLPYLVDERQKIEESLRTRTEGGYILHVCESLRQIPDIGKFMSQYKKEINIFHYSGHAGDNFLLVGDRQVKAEVFPANLASSVESGVLKLAILNGCGTADQVKALFTVGVPVVIATSAPIGDEAATSFSTAFYNELCAGANIYDSYAAGLINAKAFRTDIPLVVQNADDLEKKADENAPLWGLFVNQKNAEQSSPFEKPSPPPAYKVNQLLLNELFNIFNNAGDAGIVEMWQRQNIQRKVVSHENIKNRLLEILPRPISDYIEVVFRPYSDGPGHFSMESTKLRVQAITDLYAVTVEFLSLIMIAQVWEIKLKEETLQIPPSISAELNTHFRLSITERAKYDHTRLFFVLRKFLMDKGLPGSVQKTILAQKIFQELLQVDEVVFESASRILSRIRSIKAIQTNENDTLYATAEEAICRLFSNLGFLHKYKLASVHTVQAIKPRHIPKNRQRYFNQIYPMIQKSQELLIYSMRQAFDSYGVGLYKDEDQFEQVPEDEAPVESLKYCRSNHEMDFLNLSPFVIDRNTFIIGSTNPQLSFFSQLNGNEYKYRDVANNIGQLESGTIINKGAGRLVCQEWDEYRSKILGESLIRQPQAEWD